MQPDHGSLWRYLLHNPTPIPLKSPISTPRYAPARQSL
jgi:hypothetical protein